MVAKEVLYNWIYFLTYLQNLVIDKRVRYVETPFESSAYFRSFIVIMFVLMLRLFKLWIYFSCGYYTTVSISRYYKRDV